VKKHFLVIFCLFVCVGFSQEYYPHSNFKLFCGSVNQELAQSVADILGVPLNRAKVSRFNDGEIGIQIQETVRGADVYILQSTCSTATSSVNDSVMELYLLARAAKRASAGSITAVIPYYGYARQDRKTESRVPISASDVAMLIEEAGIDQVICVDLHCGQIQGFFHHIPVDNLISSVIFAPYIISKNLENIVVVSPDAGGVSRVKEFRDYLHEQGVESSMAMIIKQRERAGVVDKMDLVGDVRNCTAVIIDDICDTAGTLCLAASELKKQGALKVFACITHPVFSGSAIERIQNSEIDEMVVTDTIPFREEIYAPNIQQISLAPLIARAIDCALKKESINSLFHKK